MSRFQSEVVEIDNLTGEVLNSKQTTFRISKTEEPKFVKLFIEDVGKLTSLSRPSMSLLLHSMSKMSYLNEIYYTMDDKQYYVTKTGMSIKYVEKCIMELKKKDIIHTRGKAKFVINPFYFGKGDWNNVNGIRMSIEYNNEGKVIDIIKHKIKN